MICPTCHGAGFIAPVKRLGASRELMQGAFGPCPDCNGSGQAHCCDGLQCQPEDEGDEQ